MERHVFVPLIWEQIIYNIILSLKTLSVLVVKYVKHQQLGVWHCCLLALLRDVKQDSHSNASDSAN